MNNQQQNMKQGIKQLLDKFNFIKWDRVIPFDELNRLDVYGWIEREQDNYKDFVLFTFENHQLSSFITSSVKYTNAIHVILGLEPETHVDCVKVSDYFLDDQND